MLDFFCFDGITFGFLNSPLNLQHIYLRALIVEVFTSMDMMGFSWCFGDQFAPGLRSVQDAKVKQIFLARFVGTFFLSAKQQNLLKT